MWSWVHTAKTRQFCFLLKGMVVIVAISTQQQTRQSMERTVHPRKTQRSQLVVSVLIFGLHAVGGKLDFYADLCMQIVNENLYAYK